MNNHLTPPPTRIPCVPEGTATTGWKKGATDRHRDFGEILANAIPHDAPGVESDIRPRRDGGATVFDGGRGRDEQTWGRTDMKLEKRERKMEGEASEASANTLIGLLFFT